MEFNLNPVPAADEALNVNISKIPNRYDYADGVYPGRCTEVQFVPKAEYGDGGGDYVFAFTLTGGPGKGTDTVRKIKFPEFGSMLVATAKSLGVTADKDGNLPLAQCKGRVANLEMKGREYNGKRFMNVQKVLPPTEAPQAAGPTIL